MFVAAALGIHLASLHIPAQELQNNLNPGIYYRADFGTQIGIYHNTYRRPAFYVGQSIELGAGFSVVGGLATGYQVKCQDRVWEPTGQTYEWCSAGISKRRWNPIGGLTYEVPFTVLGGTPRVWFMPTVSHKHSSVLHISVEY